jgi:hypothetical protein
MYQILIIMMIALMPIPNDLINFISLIDKIIIIWSLVVLLFILFFLPLY